jgi:hypothetical protein
LIFDGETAHKIATGAISAIVRPLSHPPPRRPEQAILSYRKPNESLDLEYLWKRDKVVQKHGHVLTSIELKPLGSLTIEQIRRLGHPSLIVFKSWFRTHVGGWADDRLVYYVTFERVGRPQFLQPLAHKQPRFDQVEDYTDSSDELDAGEVVPPHEIDEINKRRRESMGLWEQEKRTIAASLGRLSADPDTRLAAANQIRALQRQLDALDRKLSSAA